MYVYDYDGYCRFRVCLEFKEDDGKGNLTVCPKDKNAFKLRCDLEKSISITVTQISQQRQLRVERWARYTINLSSRDNLIREHNSHRILVPIDTNVLILPSLLQKDSQFQKKSHNRFISLFKYGKL